MVEWGSVGGGDHAVSSGCGFMGVVCIGLINALMKCNAF